MNFLNPAIELYQRQAQALTRRHFLRNCQLGLGAVALSQLMEDSALADSGKGLDANRQAENPLVPKPPMIAPRAKNVIYLHMAGSPPQHELFDYKPTLVKHHLQPCPEELLKGKTFAFIKTC